MCNNLGVREEHACLGADGNLQYMLRGKRRGVGQQGEMRLQRSPRSFGSILKTTKHQWKFFCRGVTYNINIRKQTKQNTH